MSTTDPTGTNIAAALEAGKQALTASERLIDIPFVADEIPMALTRNGETLRPLTEVLQLHDERATAPRRRKGIASFTELASFIDHVNRFKDAHSVIFAETEEPKLVAVLDYHEATAAGAPRWGQHRSVYSLPLSRAWKLWGEHDGQKMRQEVFAQFIEDHMDDLASPSGSGDDKDLPLPSELLTMARNLTINSKGTFSRSINPTTGEGALICKNENESTSTKIPRAFLLGIPVFEAGTRYAVQARLRLDMSGGAPLFSYALYRADEIKRDAFGEVRTMAAQRTELPVLAGTPE